MPEPNGSRSAEEGLDLLGANIVDTLKDGLVEITDDVEAQGTQYAPVDRGDLRANIRRTTDFKIESTFGRTRIGLSVIAATDYAAIQHENTQFNHPKGGQAKYLTGPFEAKKAQYQEMMATVLRKALRETRI